MQVFSWDSVHLFGVLLDTDGGVCWLLLKVQARSVAAHVGWQVTLLMSAFFRGYSATGLERFSASARWHEISAVTPRWEGGDSIKNSADTCRRRLLLLSRHQQSHFHWIVFQCHLFCLLYFIPHFPLSFLLFWRETAKDLKDLFNNISTACHSFDVLSIHCPMTVSALLVYLRFCPFCGWGNALCPCCIAWHWVATGH